MGIGGISIWQLLIVLLIVVLLFGTKKLKGIGTDLGGAVKGFKKAINDDSAQAKEEAEETISAEKSTETEEKSSQK